MIPLRIWDVFSNQPVDALVLNLSDIFVSSFVLRGSRDFLYLVCRYIRTRLGCFLRFPEIHREKTPCWQARVFWRHGHGHVWAGWIASVARMFKEVSKSPTVSLLCMLPPSDEVWRSACVVFYWKVCSMDPELPAEVIDAVFKARWTHIVIVLSEDWKI